MKNSLRPCQILLQAGGGPFALYARTIEEFQEPNRASVKFKAKSVRSYVKSRERYCRSMA